jgi:predicted dehydrogenase
MAGKNEHSHLDRRRFIKSGTLGAFGLLLGKSQAVPLAAASPPPEVEEFFGPPVRCAIIGAGPQGREILAELARIPGALLHVVCDTYAPALRRIKRTMPELKTVEDYRLVLDDPEVTAVFVATPSHLHREIAVAALEAGKHVYCEAPLASSIEDARAIAAAAQKVEGQLIFQSGLQYRSEPQHRFVQTFIQTGALGTEIRARSQWQRKDSWRRVAPTREREIEANWRLQKEYSAGLMGEAGLHHIDVISGLLQRRPLAVSGFGGIRLWNDGRDVADTAEAVFEFPNKLFYSISCNLGNSFEGAFDILYGSDSAVLLRETRAWMFRESDAPLLGWEVYARQEKFFQDTGISLMADATQLAGDGVNLETVEIGTDSPLYCAVKDFVECVREDITPHAGYQEGFDATVVAIKANEAVVQGTRIEFSDEWFEIS